MPTTIAGLEARLKEAREAGVCPDRHRRRVLNGWRHHANLKGVCDPGR